LHGIYRDGGAIHVSTNRKLKSICADVVAHTTLRMTSSDITYFGPLPATVVDRAIMELAEAAADGEPAEAAWGCGSHPAATLHRRRSAKRVDNSATSSVET
jgi:hypothetical protein